MQAVSAVAISLTFSSGSPARRNFLLDPLRKLAAVQPSAQWGDKESGRWGLSHRITAPEPFALLVPASKIGFLVFGTVLVRLHAARALPLLV